MTLNKQTASSKYLVSLVFNKEALPTLAGFGLINVYIDDYGYHKKYTGDCLFFLFSSKNKTDYDSFEQKIANFNAFFDYYDIITPTDEQRMYVFKVHPVYSRDYFSFRHGRFDELSPQFFKVVDPEINIDTLKVELDKEIYRYYLYLETNKEGL